VSDMDPTRPGEEADHPDRLSGPALGPEQRRDALARLSNEVFDVLVNQIRKIPGVERADFLLNLKILKDNYEWSPAESPNHG